MHPDPYPSDVVHDREFRELVDLLFTHTGMYVSPPTLETVLAYIQGFDHARDGGPLIGFHQWLVVRRDGGNNLHWTGHILSATQTPDDANPGAQLELAHQLFRQFFEDRRAKGVARIFDAYASWLRSQSWYRGPL